jgi:hypothetical protein
VKKPPDFIREHQSDLTLALFLVAGLIGICSQAIVPGRPVAEMWGLAGSIASHGVYANPFSTMPTGPTANNPPLYPLFLVGLIKGLRVPYLIFLVSVMGCILANATTAVLLPRISKVFFADAAPGIVASILWLGAMRSILEWDTNYTIAGLVFFCCFTASFIGVDKSSGTRAVAAGAVAGLLCLLNPASILVMLPWIGFLFWKARKDRRRAVTDCGMILAVLCLFVFGWCERNYRVLGAFVIRTDLGIALYASNNDCAQPTLIGSQLNGCSALYHPNENMREAQEFRSMGEIQYDRSRIDNAKAWMRANPARFLRLTATRIFEFWFPAWEVLPPGAEFRSNFGIANSARNWIRQQNGVACAIWIVTGLSLPGLFLMARRREPVVLFILAVMAIYPLMYYVVVSDMRYRFPILWLSLLPAGYFLCELLGRHAKVPIEGFQETAQSR